MAIACTFVFLLAAKSWHLVARSMNAHPNFPDAIMREAAQRFRDEFEALSRKQSTYLGAGLMFVFIFAVAHTFEAHQLFEGYPAWQTPWATFNAINMNTGKYLWTVPFGEYEELAEQGLTNTGSENHGGSVLTSTGVLFAGGTWKDRKFYAYDSANGEILWAGLMPGYDRATPATYAVDGKQYVVIAGNPKRNSGGEYGLVTYVAFALP